MNRSLNTSGSSTPINTIGAILGSLLVGIRTDPAARTPRHDPARCRRRRHRRDRHSAQELARGGTDARIRAGRRRGVAIAMAPEWDRSLLSSGAYKYAPAMRGPSLETALTAGELRVVSRRIDGHGGRASADRHNVAGDRRQSRRVERRRHVDAAAARAHAAAAPSEPEARRHPWTWQRRDVGIGTDASA